MSSPCLEEEKEEDFVFKGFLMRGKFLGGGLVIKDPIGVKFWSGAGM